MPTAVTTAVSGVTRAISSTRVRAMLGQQRGGTSIAAPITPFATLGSPIYPRRPIRPRRDGASEPCLNHCVGRPPPNGTGGARERGPRELGERPPPLAGTP